MHVDSLYAERALRAGARGYVTKQQPLKILLEAIHAVLDGRIYMSEQASENILRRLSGPGTGSRAATEGLTDREFEVFQLIGDGQDNDHIASRLHLSPKTVAVHSTNIRGKLKLPSYVDLVRYAILQQQVRNLSAPP
jgi:DNA-binding NarL/FixJ family response regulator